MALSPEQLRLRDGKLTASNVGALMAGDDAKLFALWQQMVGDPAYVARDWPHIWPVRLGEASEALNLEWWEYKTGRRLSRQGEVVTHPNCEWACATLDAFDDGLIGPVDAKHVGGFEPVDTVVARYTPQMHWQMFVTGTKRSALSIIVGAKEPIVEYVEWDNDYFIELWQRATAFMQCVWGLTPPVALPPAGAPVVAAREVDMSGSNWWAEQAAAWLATHKQARSCEVAGKELKKLVAADAKRTFGAGIEIVRDRANRMSIREMT